MKKKIFIPLLIAATTVSMNLQAQVRIGEDKAPEKGAILDLNSAAKGGLLLPNINIEELDEIPSTFTDAESIIKSQLTGLTVYSLTPCPGVYVWSGTEWKKLGCPCLPSAASTSISVSGTTVCSGSSATLTATASTLTNPIFKWYATESSTEVLSTSASYTTPAVSVETSYYVTVSSDGFLESDRKQVALTVNTSVTPAVSIDVSLSANILTGESVTFTATPTGGGDSPSYQWKKNDSNVTTGVATGNTYTANDLVNNDEISCVMSSSAACADPASAASGKIKITVINPETGAGTLTGKTCFDIRETDSNTGQGTLAGRAYRANFTGNAANNTPDIYNFDASTQTYSFTGGTGGGKNLRLTYVDNEGVVVSSSSAGTIADFNSGDIATLTLNFRNDLNTRTVAAEKAPVIRGRKRADAALVYVYALYETADGSPLALKLQVNIQDGACCGAYLNPAHTQWLAFMCHNLGADQSLDPFGAPVTREMHGDWYKFGAKNPTLKNTLANDSYNASGTGVGQWGNTIEKPLETGTDVSWSAANNPCPAGWVLPNYTQWQNVSNNARTVVGDRVNGSFDAGLMVGDLLFLPAGGYRNETTGELSERGMNEFVWCRTSYSTTNGFSMQLWANAWYLSSSESKAAALQIRCVSQ